MSPLPSPEERRKRLKIPGLEHLASRPQKPQARRKSPSEIERERQRTEARRRSHTPSRGY